MAGTTASNDANFLELKTNRRFREQADVPATNNATERVIGNWRIRGRRVCGFKPWSALANAFILCNATLP